MNLELIPTVELLEELQTRFEHSVFAGIKVRPYTDPPADYKQEGTQFEMRRVEGNSRTCQGLCVGLLFYAEALHDEKSSAAEDDEPPQEVR